MSAAQVHVLHVVPGLSAGGMELAMARLIGALEAAGMRHTVVCLTGEPSIRDQFPGSVTIHCLRAKPNEALLPLRLYRLIRQVRPTVIHARNWGAWPDVALARLLAWPPVPLIFSFHGFANTAQMPWRRRLAFRVLSRITTYPLTVCEASRRMLVDQFGWPREKVRVVPNGVDLARFSPCRCPRTTGSSLVIGCTGSLTPVKNHALLLRAVATLVAAGIDCTLRIAGEGRQRPQLETLAAQLGLASRVYLAGHVDDMPAFLRELDLFALPSTSEAHPNGLLEAMACGLPCVATRVGGVAEILDGGRCGHLVPAGNIEAFSQALYGLSISPENRKTLGIAARQRVVECYSVQRMAAAYAGLYREASEHASLFLRARAEVNACRNRPPVARPTHLALTRTLCQREREHAHEILPGRPKLHVLQLGPLPPLTGGMATVADNLRRSELAEAVDLWAINNGKTTAAGRRLLAGIWAQARLLAQVVGTVRRHRIRLVHIHTCALFSFWRDIVHMSAVRLFRCRVIWHLHDGTFLRFLSEGNPIKRAVIRWALSKGSATVVLSHEARDRLRPHAPKARWRVVANGVPVAAPLSRGLVVQPCGAAAGLPRAPSSRLPSSAEPPRTPTLPGKPGSDRRLALAPVLPSTRESLERPSSTGRLQLLFLGNLTRRKGAYDLIAAVEAAAARGVCVSLLLAGGEVDTGQQAEIERRIAGSPCADRIHLLGMITGDAKRRAIAQAQGIALPSYAEGLPMALLEGMAAGLPAIATRVGSVTSMIDDGVEGFLIDPGDVAALADRILRLATDAELRHRMGWAAYQRVQRQFSLHAMAQRVYEIYLEACNELPNGRHAPNCR